MSPQKETNHRSPKCTLMKYLKLKNPKSFKREKKNHHTEEQGPDLHRVSWARRVCKKIMTK